MQKLIVKGQSEYQIALRKRFTGAKSSYEKVRVLPTHSIRKSSVEFEDPNLTVQRQRDIKLSEKIAKVEIKPEVLLAKTENK